ncbi:MAG: DUF255 domain-containing protein [Isosphaerales bacterium]
MHRSTSSLVRIGLFVLLVPPGIGRADDDAAKTKGRPANRLAKETSPYLLLHAHNPVDWYPWGPEALARAKAESKPIFLSVGYSSCYWCHVMERESFMDPEIARVLNANFVCIKVDREERPDVDQVYMAALQALGPGGWPMSLFLTPDGRPFFGGTYFPPRDRQGSSGFLTIVTEVARAWAMQRDEIEKAAVAVTDAARRRLKASSSLGRLPLARTASADGRAELGGQFDPEHGGFGFNPNNPRRPKFPQAVDLMFLLDQHRRGARSNEAMGPLEMVLLTLDRMARGGIRDQLGGGYHRYSTDRYWIVPHFEKMLYDNAQLATVHLAAHEITKDPRWRREAEATFAFIEQKMTAPEGGFYSALDAETKGVEGATYVWTRDEVKAVLGEGPDVDAFARVYGLTGEPKIEDGRYVLYEPRTRAEQAAALKTTTQELEARLRPLRARLLAAREKRPAPLLDDKVITAWNGLMIAAYADGYRALKVETYRQAAEKAAGFLLETLRSPDGRLLRTYRQGKAKLPAYQEDYAFLVQGLLRLHQATGVARWLREAESLTERMLADFEDREQGGFFFTANDHESLLARAKDPFDNALPSGNSIAILNLLELHRATGKPAYLEHAGKALDAFSTSLSRLPAAMPLGLVGLEQYLDAKPSLNSRKPLTPGAAGDAQARVVAASARLPDGTPAAIAPGREFEALIRVTIQPSWHIYANPTGLPEMKPTTLDLDRPSQKIATLLKVAYPAGEAKVLGSLGTEKVALYEKDVLILARLRIAEDANPGPVVLKFKLSYQACNDRLCEAPAKMEIPLSVSVGR